MVRHAEVLLVYAISPGKGRLKDSSDVCVCVCYVHLAGKEMEYIPMELKTELQL